ncbi:MAG TPA: DNA polymerase I [Tissierellia bacterium]|nr:DNA polymerase I [Tissierellia bacterium]
MKQLMIIDGNSILNRAFYALPPLTTKDGIHTNAIHGFLSMLIQVVREKSPDFLVVTFDTKGGNFRHEMYADYKGTRKGMPDELAEQLPILKEILDDLAVYRIERPGFEADDLIGTLCRISTEEKIETTVITGDKDMLQLVDEDTVVGITRRGTKDVVYYTEELVKQDLGIRPDQVVDYKGIRGDSSDNIPGIPGIGDVGATKLLNAYDHLEDIYDHLDEIKGKQKERLIEHKELAILSRELAKIDTTVPLDSELSDYEFHRFNGEQAQTNLAKYELKSIANLLSVDLSAGMRTAEAAPKSLAEDQMVAIALEPSGAGRFVVLTSEPTFMTSREFLETYHRRPHLIVYNLQDWAPIFKQFSLDWPATADDVMLENYLIYPERGGDSLWELVGRSTEPQTDEDWLGVAALLAAKHSELQAELKAKELLALYHEIELPLVPILARMSEQGFAVDRSVLRALDDEISLALKKREDNIHQLAGSKFNINSPKQLGVVLFEELGLPVVKKTKTGYSTNRDVLVKLADRHPIISEILEYRILSKLKGTYIDGLEKVITDQDRIHTTFRQTIAVTGRLSSTDPNLQNIPIRLPEGRRIRQMFVASDDDHVLLAADYSQIELRVLAHISGDEHLIEAYHHDHDIHRLTASKVFGTPYEEVTYDQRREAKAVNFGIVYGMSDFGLSENIDIPISAAKEYIQRYFEEYPRIKQYMDEAIRSCRETGYVKTLLGRIRMIPEIQAKNYNLRSFAERTAINTPIQGSAADIIKLSMIRVDRALKEQGLESKLILQVHDELIFDAKKSELEQLKALVVEAMEGAYQLIVPLRVSLDTGENWYETT